MTITHNTVIGTAQDLAALRQARQRLYGARAALLAIGHPTAAVENTLRDLPNIVVIDVPCIVCGIAQGIGFKVSGTAQPHAALCGSCSASVDEAAS